ncbi:hypothetical protein EDB83DRAFT_2669924 [Lactarius deliciosus]|nr:hypothetical protein EDB83DRAFT_2669924 [Lactarius deliciosus]
MALNNQATPTNSYNVVFDAALKEYKEKTKQSLEGHTLLTQLEICDSPTAVVNILEGQVNANANEGLKKWLNPMINVLYAFSATLGEMFPPTKMIFAGVGVLLSVVKDLNEDQGTLVDIFEQIENFFRRLGTYTEVPPTPAMMNTMVKIMAEVLNILAIATKAIKQGRAKKPLNKLAGWTVMEDALKRLDKLTTEEARMVNAQILTNTHITDVKLTGVEKKVQGVDTQMKNVRGELRRVYNNIDDEKGSSSVLSSLAVDHLTHLQEISYGSPIVDSRQTGLRKECPCSAIIEDIMTLCKAGLTSLAYFYFDFRDIDKQSLSKLLPSLLVQLSTHSDPRRNILTYLYEAHGNGAHRPNDRALTHCLKEMLALPDQRPIYLILDALDECTNISGFPSARRRVLDLVKDLVGLQLPKLHICVTSRPEVDIRDIIEPLAFHSVSLHDETGQKEDIATYVRSVVYSDSGAAMSRWRVEEKELALTDKVDGM